MVRGEHVGLRRPHHAPHAQPHDQQDLGPRAPVQPVLDARRCVDYGHVDELARSARPESREEVGRFLVAGSREQDRCTESFAMRYVYDSPLQLGHLVWALRPPTRSLLVVVKGTFDPAAGSPAPFAEESVPPTGETFLDDDCLGPQVLPSDFAPMKPCGETMIVGTARCIGPTPRKQLECEFTLGEF
ncbi:MAG TPA: DUF2169 domain-containing protein, partial [Polyangiaceae bacterium]|nr:DUF2169 domain-containing protein [Polyangiaceae bacterium]